MENYDDYDDDRPPLPERKPPFHQDQPSHETTHSALDGEAFPDSFRSPPDKRRRKNPSRPPPATSGSAGAFFLWLLSALLALGPLLALAGAGPAVPPLLIRSDMGKIILKLQKPERATKCEVIRDNGRGSMLNVQVWLGACGDLIRVEGLDTDLNYRFQMRGLDSSNNAGPFSNMVSYVSAGIPVYNPADKPTLTKIGATDIRVSWVMPDKRGTPVLGFVVMQDINDKNNWQVVYNGTTQPNVFNTDIVGLNPTDILRFRVYAVNRVGTSANVENVIQLSR